MTECKEFLKLWGKGCIMLLLLFKLSVHKTLWHFLGRLRCLYFFSNYGPSFFQIEDPFITLRGRTKAGGNWQHTSNVQRLLMCVWVETVKSFSLKKRANCVLYKAKNSAFIVVVVVHEQWTRLVVLNPLTISKLMGQTDALNYNSKDCKLFQWWFRLYFSRQEMQQHLKYLYDFQKDSFTGFYLATKSLCVLTLRLKLSVSR